MLDIDSIKHYISVIVEKKEMITVDKYGFLDNFVIEKIDDINRSSSGGVGYLPDTMTPDGVSFKPFIRINENSMRKAKWWIDTKNQDINTKNLTPSAWRKYKAAKLGKILFVEYDDFCEDPAIGDYLCDDTDTYLRCVVAHEMAHCLQFWNREPGFSEEDVHALHNDVWKEYYRILRREMGLVRKQNNG